jgi:tetratricopeptide (TPR) repeat protein
MNRQAEGFHLQVVDKYNQPTGKSVYFQFKDVKCVFYVKSYDGRFDPEKYDHSMPEGGVPLVLVFEDGETIKGHALSNTWMRELRFFFVPEDSASNNIGMLVERTAATQILTPDEYKKMQHAEVEAFLARHTRPGMSRGELLGDFYFGKHNYVQALRHYREVREKEDTAHIRKKLCTAKYNVAVCHIRQRDYQGALRYMELVLELDPDHEQAKRKAEQLREHLTKHRH